MKKHQHSYPNRILLLLLHAIVGLLISCPGAGSPAETTHGNIDSYFWGSWVRMDGSNEEWYISDSRIAVEENSWDALESSTASVLLSSLHRLEKKTGNMLAVSSAGYTYYLFRKSGATADISGGVMSLASGDEEPSGMAGVEVSMKNRNNPANVVTAVSDAEGHLDFTGIIAKDEYILTIPKQTNVRENIEVSVTPEFDGEDIGNITLTDAEQNFKVSYSLSESDEWGYYYASLDYELEISFTNIGTADLLGADYEIYPPEGLAIYGESLMDIFGTIQADGGKKTLSFSVSADPFTEDYMDFDIPVNLYSYDGLYQWNDSIRLRFFRETMSINVRSEDDEVQGVVISPDSRSFPFLTSGNEGSITLPARSNGYILALSGAEYSSETKYALRLNGAPDSNGTDLTSATRDEPNNDEENGTSAFTGSDYLGYLGVYDLDFFRIFNASTFVEYNNNGADSGSLPLVDTLQKPGDLYTIEGNVGELLKDGFTFSGWNTAEDGEGAEYTAGSSLLLAEQKTVLFAQWERNSYSLSYDANGATSGDLPGTGGDYFFEQRVTLPSDTGELVNGYYPFFGWNTESDGTGDSYSAGADISIPSHNVVLYADWDYSHDDVTGLSPANGGTTIDTTPLLNWGNVNDAVSYRIRYADTSSGLSGADYVFVTESQFPVDQPVENGKTIYWRVTPINGQDIIGEESPVFSFRIAVPAGITIEDYEPAEDIDITFSGTSPGIAQGEDMTIIAETSSAVDSWEWYLDGELILEETSGAIVVGGDLFPGGYTLALFVTKGDAVYSASHFFEVIDIPRDNLVLEYLFEGSSDDTSGNGYHGTVYNAVPAEDYKGRADSAYYFDGVNDYIISPSVTIDWSDGFTASVWAKKTGGGDSKGDSTIVTQSGGSYNHVFRLYVLDSGELPGAWGYRSNTSYSVTSGTALSDWTHITLRFESGMVTIYINGELTGTDSFSSPLNSINTPIRLGQWITGEYDWQGYIDNLRLYNRALTESEISILAQE